MAEAIGLAASIAQIAQYGLICSKELYKFSKSLSDQETNLERLTNHVEANSRMLQRLGELLERQGSISRGLQDDIQIAANSCERVFKNISDISNSMSAQKQGLKRVYQKTKYAAFHETQVKEYREELSQAQITLTLMMHIHWHSEVADARQAIVDVLKDGLMHAVNSQVPSVSNVVNDFVGHLERLSLKEDDSKDLAPTSTFDSSCTTLQASSQASRQSTGPIIMATTIPADGSIETTSRQNSSPETIRTMWNASIAKQKVLSYSKTPVAQHVIDAFVRERAGDLLKTLASIDPAIASAVKSHAISLQEILLAVNVHHKEVAFRLGKPKISSIDMVTEKKAAISEAKPNPLAGPSVIDLRHGGRMLKRSSRRRPQKLPPPVHDPSVKSLRYSSSPEPYLSSVPASADELTDSCSEDVPSANLQKRRSKRKKGKTPLHDGMPPPSLSTGHAENPWLPLLQVPAPSPRARASAGYEDAAADPSQMLPETMPAVEAPSYNAPSLSGSFSPLFQMPPPPPPPPPLPVDSSTTLPSYDFAHFKSGCMTNSSVGNPLTPLSNLVGESQGMSDPNEDFRPTSEMEASSAPTSADPDRQGPGYEREKRPTPERLLLVESAEGSDSNAYIWIPKKRRVAARRLVVDLSPEPDSEANKPGDLDNSPDADEAGEVTDDSPRPSKRPKTTSSTPRWGPKKRRRPRRHSTPDPERLYRASLAPAYIEVLRDDPEDAELGYFLSSSESPPPSDVKPDQAPHLEGQSQLQGRLSPRSKLGKRLRETSSVRHSPFVERRRRRVRERSTSKAEPFTTEHIAAMDEDTASPADPYSSSFAKSDTAQDMRIFDSDSHTYPVSGPSPSLPSLPPRDAAEPAQSKIDNVDISALADVLMERLGRRWNTATSQHNTSEADQPATHWYS